MKADNAAALVSGDKTLSDFYVHGMNPEEFEEMMKSLDDQLESVKLHQTWVQNVLGMKPGKNAVVVNGKVRAVFWVKIDIDRLLKVKFFCGLFCWELC